MSDDATKKTRLEIVSEEALDEDEAEFRKLRRDLPGVKGASVIGIVAVSVGKIPTKNEFFRTHPEFRPVVPLVDVEVGMEKQFFAVDDGMVVALAGIGITVSDHTLYLTVTPRGAVRIIPIHCATDNEYTRTKEIGLLDGVEQWVRWWVYPMGKVLLPACYAVHLVDGRWEVVRPTPTATNTADLGAGLR